MKNNTDKSKKEINITKDMNIADLVFKYPEAEEVLAAFGLHCATCFAAGFDTLEQGGQIHGMPDDEIDEMIEEVNLVLNKKYNESKE